MHHSNKTFFSQIAYASITHDIIHNSYYICWKTQPINRQDGGIQLQKAIRPTTIKKKPHTAASILYNVTHPITSKFLNNGGGWGREREGGCLINLRDSALYWENKHRVDVNIGSARTTASIFCKFAHLLWNNTTYLCVIMFYLSTCYVGQLQSWPI